MMKFLRYIFVFCCLTIFLCSMAGCFGKKGINPPRDMNVQVRASDAIFLPPTAASKHTVFVQVNNVTTFDGLHLLPLLQGMLKDDGYTLVTSPNGAYYILNVNVLYANTLTDQQASQMLHAGFQGIVSQRGNTKEDTTPQVQQGDTKVFSGLIADVEISERISGSQSYGTSNWNKYQTRIVVTGEKESLRFADAEPVLSDNLAKTIVSSF